MLVSWPCPAVLLPVPYQNSLQTNLVCFPLCLLEVYSTSAGDAHVDTGFNWSEIELAWLVLGSLSQVAV